MSGKRYTIGQLRGAFAAGQRAQSEPRRSKPLDAKARHAAFMEAELVRLAAEYGLVRAFSNTRDGYEYVETLMVQYLACGGDEFEVADILDRVSERFDEYEPNEAWRAYAEHALECRLAEAIEKRAAVLESLR